MSILSDMTKRTELYKQLPLDMPFSLHVFVSYCCNFKCSYCLQSLPDTDLVKKGFKRQYMTFEDYTKTIDDAARWEQPLKALIFAGHGEPLMHKNIADMVAYAKKKGVANRVEIVTNGSLLTPDLSDALINAGLDRLRISVQGTDAMAYEKTMGRKFDFDSFVRQLKYFYEHKSGTEVFCKIIDVALSSEHDAQKFHDIFDPIADETAIEYEIPFVKEVDNAGLKDSFEFTKSGKPVQDIDVCAMPFYMLVVTPNGDVVPCCSTDVPIVYGNIRQSSLQEIWNNGIHNGFCRVQLLGNRYMHPVCSTCSVPVYGMQPGDYLDEHRDELIGKYVMKRGEGNGI